MNSFSKLQRRAFLKAFLILSLLFPLRGYAQTAPEQVQISSHFEEDLTILGECPDYPDGTQNVEWTIYLAWDVAPDAPFYDTQSPIGYWGTLGASSVPYPAMMLPPNHHWREQLVWMRGCFHIEKTRQAYRDQNWRVSAEFHYPEGGSGRVSSATTDFDGQPDLIARSKLVSVEGMTITKDPINIATGEMILQATDSFLEGKGPALQLTRTYRSQSNAQGLFGYGWHSAYDRNLTEDIAGNVRIFNEQGGGQYFNKKEDGDYLPSPGSYAMLAKGANGLFAVTDKRGIVTTYGLEGRMSSITDRNNNTLRFVFDPAGSGTAYIEDAGGRRIRITLDASGRIIAAEDPAGRTMQYTYDASGNLITVTDPDGNFAAYEYNNSHNIVKVTNRNGHHTYFAYDPSDRAIRNWQDDDVNKVTLTYPAPGRTDVDDALGRRSIYYHNQFGLTVREVDALGNTRREGWDLNMNRTSVTDARGYRTEFEYDDRGNLIHITDPLGAQTVYTYTGDFNLVDSRTDALNNSMFYSYDERGNLLTVTDALGQQTRMDYDASGNLINTTDPMGHVTVFEYDAFGQVVRTADALSNTTLMTYDASGNNLSKTDAQGNTTEFIYDAVNRLVTVRFADGTEESYGYDAYGNQISVTDRNGRTTTHDFDVYERLVRVVDPLGNAMQYSYDKEGNALSLTDPKGGVTTFAYDALGRLSRETSPTGKTAEYLYDPDGNQDASIDPNGHMVRYVHDAMNRLVHKEYPDQTGVSFSYDALGRQISMTDGRGVTYYNYDALGRLLSVHGPEPEQMIGYTYDAAGNRTEMITQDGRMISYGYDALNRPTSISDASGSTEYLYDALSNTTGIYYPSGASVNYSYDAMGRPVEVTNIGAKDITLAANSYIHNAAGMVVQKKDENGTTTDYQYDGLDRLVRETKKGTDSKSAEKVLYDYQYLYDANGNRTQLEKMTTLRTFWVDDVNDMPQKVLDNMKAAGYSAPKRRDPDKPLSLVKTYSYDADNRLLSWDHAIEIDALQFPIETVVYAYDSNGNRGQERRVRTGELNPIVTNYEYDYQDQLTGLSYENRPNTENILSAVFEYDGNGLRTKAIEGDTITQYYHDGSDIVLETDGLGVTRRSYLRAPGLPGGIRSLISERSLQEEVIGKGKNKEVALIEKNNYYHYDALGSVVGLSEDSGYAVARYDYDAFGRPLQVTDSIANDYLFATKEYEKHAGLYFFGARYYDPFAGRWLTPDPMGFIDGPNVYAYVKNNPVNLVDLFGYDAIVLNAPRGAAIAGHQAIAIGDDQTGWDYYSREGFKAPNTHEKFNSLQEMLASHDGSLAKRYFNKFRIPTTADQDHQMRTYANRHINDRYSLLYNNCSDLVTGALQSGGIKTGYRPIGNWPNIAYKNIIHANTKE